MSLRFLPAVALILLVAALTLFSNLTPNVKTAPQQEARNLKDRTWDSEPIKVVAVKGKDGRTISLGKEQMNDDDWLRDLTISIKNVSDKNILFVELELHFIRPADASDTDIAAFPITMGTRPALITAESAMLAPHKKWETSLTAQQYAMVGELLAGAGYPVSIKNVELITREVVFADKTKWIAGRTYGSASLSKTLKPQSMVSQKKSNWGDLSASQF